MQQDVNIQLRNTKDEAVKVVAAILVDKDGNLVSIGSGGGDSSALAAQIKMPTYSAVTIVSVASPTTGANWATFGAQACEGLDLVNDTGTAIEYRRGGAGNSIGIAAGSSRLITGITNANQISVRRVDQNNTSVNVKAEAFKV